MSAPDTLIPEDEPPWGGSAQVCGNCYYRARRPRTPKRVLYCTLHCDKPVKVEPVHTCGEFCFTCVRCCGPRKPVEGDSGTIKLCTYCKAKGEYAAYVHMLKQAITEQERFKGRSLTRTELSRLTRAVQNRVKDLIASRKVLMREEA